MASINQFRAAPQANIQRSSFDRSHGLLTTFDAGYLVPIFVDEVLPGDTHSMSMTGFARLATPIKPVMDNMYMETFWFFVPNRLVWENWKNLMGEQHELADINLDNPDMYETPKIVVSNGALVANFGQAENTIYDYMGLPVHAPSDFDVSALPFRAYNLIWNEWFRDQSLQDKITENKGGGQDPITDYYLKRRGKRHDYFTSCLPWPQKGPDVNIPTLDTAPVVADGTNPKMTQTSGGAGNALYGTTGQKAVEIVSTWGTSGSVFWGDNTGLEVDLSSATSVRINDLRQAFQLQRFLEKDARSGTRYAEVIQSHFGVVSPDARLQRPEYLGGGSSRVSVKPVEQNSEGDVSTTPQGNLAGVGTAVLNNHGFTKSFTEHGFIIGLVNVRADLTYQQGLNRMWMRKARTDYYWPSFAHLGEQAVWTEEIFTEGGATMDVNSVSLVPEPNATPAVFGYQERYAEYRYKPSQVTGLFRSDAQGTLDIWHLAQHFDSAPLLNSSFIQDDPPVDRVIAVQDEPHFLFDGYFKYRSVRPMPMYGIPGLMDRI